MRILWLSAFLSIPIAAQTSPVGRDWFVRPGGRGDGSQTAPFYDPWQALERCEAGDRIHIAAGRYLGKFRGGTWEIPVDHVQLLGGYDAEFRSRDPWRQPTQLGWDRKSKNWPKAERLRSNARDVVVDGLILDMQDQNDYADEQHTARSPRPGAIAIRLGQTAEVRNCVLINTGEWALECATGSKIENNLVANTLTWGIVVSSSSSGGGVPHATLQNNTVLRCWDLESPGRGGYRGALVALRRPAHLVANILAFADNSAIYATAAPGQIRLVGNMFWGNRFANMTSEGPVRGVAKDASMELLEDLGLQELGDNPVRDPGLPFVPAGHPAAGAPPAEGAGQPQPGIAPALSLEQAIRIVAANTHTAGARIVPLTVPTFAPVAPAAAVAYAPKSLLSWHANPASVQGQHVELTAAIGSVANITGMPKPYAPESIAGVFLYDPEGNGTRITGFYAKGSQVERLVDRAKSRYDGIRRPDQVFRVRGTAYVVANVPKAAMHIDQIERMPTVVPERHRPTGRDWYVRAGATGGDGSQTKPFRDPFQALERCAAGDTIHVAAGEYHGKLKAGRWAIAAPFVTLLGGYDQDFAVRAPWSTPSCLSAAKDFDGNRAGYVLAGDGDHLGAVVDGFVFDKRHDNAYEKSGGLNPGRSDRTEHLWLSRPACVVRNCLFVNGASGAVRIANGVTLENNVFVNHVTQTVAVERGHGVEPAVLRHNTLLFCWDREAGTGRGRSGSLLRLQGGTVALLEHNVFGYADNDAIRVETDPSELVLRNNRFGQNLWSNVQSMSESIALDDGMMDHLGDLGLVAADNAIGLPDLPIAAAWLAQHQAVRKPSASAPPAPPPPPAKPNNPFDPGASPEPPTALPRTGGNPFGAGDTGSASREPSSQFAPAYDRDAALTLFVNSATVGARRVDLPARKPQ